MHSCLHFGTFCFPASTSGRLDSGGVTFGGVSVLGPGACLALGSGVGAAPFGGSGIGAASFGASESFKPTPAAGKIQRYHGVPEGAGPVWAVGGGWGAGAGFGIAGLGFGMP